MKTIPPLFIAAILSLAQASQAATVPPKQDSVVIASSPQSDIDSAAHAAAVRSMLDALHFVPILRHMISTAHFPTPEERQVSIFVFDHSSDDDLMRRIVPVYVRHISTTTAQRVTAHYTSSIGRRRANAELSRMGVLNGEKNPYFTDSEQREIKAFEASMAAHELADPSKALQADMQAMMAAWMIEFIRHTVATSMETIGAQAKAAVTAYQYQPGEPVPTIEVAPTGLAFLDQVAKARAQYDVAMALVNRAYSMDLKQSDLQHVLAPDRLTTKDGLQKSRSSLQYANRATEGYLQQAGQVTTNFRNRVKAILSSERFIAGFEKNVGQTYDWLIAYGENQRKLFDLTDRILTFAESRDGKISVQDDKLLFQEAADQQIYDTLRTQIKQLTAEEKQLAQPHNDLQQASSHN